MATYLMSGKYSLDAVRKISVERTEQALALLKKHGGKLKSAYAMLGKDDLLLIVDLPDTAQAMKTSIALAQLLGISFTTSPAVTMEEFDRMMTEG